MASSTDDGKFWPWMILGFIFIGVFLGFWTIKSTSSLPVHESNDFMQKYQLADIYFNQIQEAQERFDAKYVVEVSGLKLSSFQPKHLKRKQVDVLALASSNLITITVRDRQGTPINDANVSLLLTRPFTQNEDQKFLSIPGSNGTYTLKDLKPGKPGRYLIYIRTQIKDAIDYYQHEAYLEPKK
jgi:hypothetical protein